MAGNTIDKTRCRSGCGSAVEPTRKGPARSCTDCVARMRRARSAEYKARQRAKGVDRSMRDQHRGLDEAGLAEMVARQGGRCLGCGRHPEPGKRLHIDHDHDCCGPGRSCPRCRRGLLCGPCNRALGLVRDAPEVLRSLALYLEGWQ